MSIALMTKVWSSEMPTATHKLVMLAFADHANDEGFGWPSLKRIAERTQLSKRQTQRIVDDLKEMGVLAVVIPHKRHRTPLYEIRGDKLTPLADLEVTSEQFRGDIQELRGDISALEVTSEQKPTYIREPSLRTVIKEPPEEAVDFSFFDEWLKAKGKSHRDDPRRRVKEAT